MSESLEIKREAKGDVLVLKLKGNITEDSHIESVASELKPVVVIDLQGVARINSYGIRQWVNVMKEIKQKTKQLIFHRAPAPFVEQFNMISNFGGGGVVYSFALPFFCENCDQENSQLYELPNGVSPSSTPKLPTAKCPKCSKPMVFNDMEDEYFYFLQHQKGQSIDPKVLEVIRSIR
jgi:anti-anti-sigma regulatory factor